MQQHACLFCFDSSLLDLYPLFTVIIVSWWSVRGVLENKLDKCNPMPLGRWPQRGQTWLNWPTSTSTKASSQIECWTATIAPRWSSEIPRGILRSAGLRVFSQGIWEIRTKCGKWTWMKWLVATTCSSNPNSMYRWYQAFWYILILWKIPSGPSHGWGNRCDPNGFSWCSGWFQAEPVNLPRLSAAPRRGSETYFQPGQYKPNLDAVRPKLELEAQDL